MSEITARLSAALAGRYTIEHELGAGGMATVYLAHDVKHNRKVAVKVLRPELAAILGAERFLKEIEVTANLQHPHILPLFDSGEADSFLYYVMPYVEGESLRDRLNREKQLAVDDAVRITAEVADALHYAHERGVIHRDVKPENILLHNGRATVADFGIALAVQQAGGSRLTETGLSLGTPHYMSPEQATADRELDAKSDVYSLGAVLYEMLTGDPPHTGSTAQAVIASVVTKTPELVTERRASVPIPIAGAVHRALEKLPADRFATSEAFSKALTDPAASVGVPAGKQPVATSPLGWPRVAGIAAAALVVGLGIGRFTTPTPAARSAVRFFHVPDSSHTVNTLCCGPLFAITRQGHRIAYPGLAATTRGIYVRDLNEMMAKRLPETEGGHSLFFSPDGEWIGFGAQGAIYKALASGGSPVHVVDIDGTLVGGTWTDAGEIIFSTWPLGGYGDTEAHHGLFVVSADGGTPQRLSAADSSDGVIDHRTPFAVPGSDAVLVTLWPTSNLTADARVAVVSRSSGRVEPLLSGMAPQFTASGHLVYASASGSVLAQRFDLRRARPLDNPRSLLVNDAKDGAAGVFTAGGGWADFAVSADGTMLFMHGDEGSALDMADRSGAIVASPFQLAGISHLDKPRFSPDGRRIAFSVAVRTAQRQPSGVQGFEAIHVVYVVDLSTGTSQRLTLEGNTQHVDWTPNGDTVVYATDGRRLFLQPADRSAPARPVMQQDDMVLGGLSMGRRYIAMALETSSGIHDVHVAARDSADKAWRYAGTNFDEAAPSIAPNERWLAYSSDETGRPEIYVSALPVAGARTVVSIDGGTEPVWGREGRTLYYRSSSGGMVAVSVDIAGDRFVVGTREELFKVNGESDVAGREYDVSPSGEEFVFVRSRGLDRRLGVVLNAITERD